MIFFVKISKVSGSESVCGQIFIAVKLCPKTSPSAGIGNRESSIVKQNVRFTSRFKVLFDFRFPIFDSRTLPLRLFVQSLAVTCSLPLTLLIFRQRRILLRLCEIHAFRLSISIDRSLLPVVRCVCRFRPSRQVRGRLKPLR